MWSRYQRQSRVHCSDTSLSTNQNLSRPQWRPLDVSQTLFCFSCHFILFEPNNKGVNCAKDSTSSGRLMFFMCELRGELMWRAENHTKDSCCPCLWIVWNHDSNQEISENKSFFFFLICIWWNCVLVRVKSYWVYFLQSADVRGQRIRTVCCPFLTVSLIEVDCCSIQTQSITKEAILRIKYACFWSMAFFEFTEQNWIKFVFQSPFGCLVAGFSLGCPIRMMHKPLGHSKDTAVWFNKKKKKKKSSAPQIINAKLLNFRISEPNVAHGQSPQKSELRANYFHFLTTVNSVKLIGQ